MGRDLEGQVAIVTGAGRGIGRAIATAVGARGAAVLVNYASNAAAAEEVAAAIETNGGRAVTFGQRLDGPVAAKALFAAALEAFGKVDILVNNAGVARFAPIETVDEREFDETFAVNVKAVFFAIQEAARTLVDGGRIVSISAAQTRVGYPNSTLYSATKGAIEQISFSAAKELGKRGILVNVVSPGATSTDLYNSLAAAAAQEVAKQRSPMGRLAQPDEIADVVAFLVGGEARWVSGQNIYVNGAALW